MNTACSTCLESFSARSDISTTMCGHVFHTDCIEKWLQNGKNQCPQCRKNFGNNQIIKLYFSESESENNLILELEEANRKFQEEANESQSQCLKFQKENLKIQGENSKIQEENLTLKEENLRLKKHLNDMETDSNKIQMTLRKKCDELTEKFEKSEKEVSNLKSKRRNLEEENIVDGNENSGGNVAKYDNGYGPRQKS